MKARLDIRKAAPEGYQAMRGLSGYVGSSGLDKSLRTLVDIRASQINGCAFCLAMHIQEGRAHGETDNRMQLLNAWRETPLYTERERAALAWTEAVTLLADTHVPDEIYEQARAQFSEQELAALTYAIVTINSWNRLMVAFREPPRLPEINGEPT